MFVNNNWKTFYIKQPSLSYGPQDAYKKVLTGFTRLAGKIGLCAKISNLKIYNISNSNSNKQG